MMTTFSTREVAKILEVPVGRLKAATWDDRIPPPPKNPSGIYEWGARDIERAAWVLLRRSVRDRIEAATAAAEAAADRSERDTLAQEGGGR